MSLNKVVMWFQRRVDDLESDNRRLGCAVIKAQHLAAAAEKNLSALRLDVADRDAARKACACGDRLALGVVHHKSDDGPCYHPEETT